MADHLEHQGELDLQEKTKESLQRTNVSSLKRILKRLGRSEPKLAEKKSRKPRYTSIRKEYPMSKIAWDIPEH
ncbi:MAG: hypothetical protein CVU40_10390 [Chloroflexi bacterium HGW-Chloroflexi-2]|jgi:hypothetical protein|nr:MAG: hypothetical protein CVU40_10390 [Chloroflexi bacterium HGW-Chloroflexi-2]